MVDLRFANSVHIMLALANAVAEEKLLTSSQLAVGLKVNPALIRKLLIPLAQSGLVETFKGKMGGARLAKSPRQISLGQIYKAVVDSDLIHEPSRYNAQCPIGSCMDKVFNQVASGMESA